MKVKGYKVIVRTKDGDYESIIDGKYEFLKAVEEVARTAADQPVQFGGSLAFIAGSFISAQLGEIVEEEA